VEHSNVVNVKSFDCFPTTIHSFSLKIDHEPMIANLRFSEEEDQLFLLPNFKPLVDGVIESTTQILKKLKYEYDKIEITNMWANKMQSGDVHPPHTHSNNFLSGVYYLKSNNTAPIQFFDPRPSASVLQPRNTPNQYNSSMVRFDSIEGSGLIFPSWLQHWVPSPQEQRISVSWNILLRGNYGKQGTLQNAYI
tara:strand:- start:147 stop:725 length:579 start_codon:yes stop_codon:yes gene_type:complete